jgi:hypothetical protein
MLKHSSEVQGSNTAEVSMFPDAALESSQPSDPFKDVPILFRSSAELYLFDTDTDVFVIQEKEVAVDLASNGEYDSECFLALACFDLTFQPGSSSDNNRPPSSQFLLMPSSTRDSTW